MSGFAISGDRGFRHVERCTDEEWARFSQRLRTHGIRELVRVRGLRQKRQNLTRVSPTPPPLIYEKHRPQALLFDLQEVG